MSTRKAAAFLIWNSEKMANIEFDPSLGQAFVASFIKDRAAYFFQPGDLVTLRVDDKPFTDEPDAAAAFAARQDLAGGTYEVERTVIEPGGEPGTIRVRNGLVGREGMVAGAALQDAGELYSGYAILCHRQGRVEVLVADYDEREGVAGKLRYPLTPVDEFLRPVRAQLAIPENADLAASAEHLLNYLEFASEPVCGEATLVRRDGRTLLVSVPWTSSCSDDDLEFLQREIARQQEASDDLVV
jgi:hypothetical protein